MKGDYYMERKIYDCFKAILLELDLEPITYVKLIKKISDILDI